MIKATKKPSSVIDMYRSKLKIKSGDSKGNGINGGDGDNDDSTMNVKSPPLKNFSLRGNQLCGSILIGNYNYLTQLEVSENEMEVLDLSSLAQLETLKCSRNKLMELMINGGNLTSVIADHNCLHTIVSSMPPVKLTHLDISHNLFTELPNWIGPSCDKLHTLLADHNHLQTANKFFNNFKISALRNLHLGYNNLRTFTRLPEKFASVECLNLQSNELQTLPENFYIITGKNLRILNISCNKLIAISGKLETAIEEPLRLEELYLSSNNLNENMFQILLRARRLRILHAAYNRIQTVPETTVRSWPELEVLVLSGNMIQHLPENISHLPRLQVLRMHSNLLLSTPNLAKLEQLKVLDLAHNHLDRVNLLHIMSKSLKYLDLSSNQQLQVDEQQMRLCQTQKNWSLIDVSGKNRPCLPTTRLEDYPDKNTLRPPWTVGFSETNGISRKLFVSQLRLGSFRADEGLFGMFESEASSLEPNALVKLVPQILRQERTVKETIGDYMKFTLLSAQQKLFKDGEYQTMGATLCHIARETQHGIRDYVRPHKTKKFILRVASAGNIRAYLVKKTTNVCLSNSAILSTDSTTGHDVTMPPPSVPNKAPKLMFPDPEIIEITLGNDDEYLVICNGHIWDVMDIDRVAREIRKEDNVLLSAKRLQDIAQSFGATKNISVVVIRFRNIGVDVDYLIKELKQSVRKKPIAPSIPIGTACKRTCCERSNACRHRQANATPGNLLFTPSPHQLSVTRSDRSSPSGQSDHAVNPLIRDLDGDGYLLTHGKAVEKDNDIEMLDETDSVLSEEQFKCWEYMLEQNTQLLFDKELNTISKSFTKHQNNERKPSGIQATDRVDHKSNLMRNINNKFISTSSPQLLYNESKKNMPPMAYHQQMSFLSKHFGSSRSFQSPMGYNLFESKSRDSMAAFSKFGGGPNAAYFGSLQRLMPYNLEYDFAVTQERSSIFDEEDEFDEHASRMRKYWGVATTEL